MFFRAKERRTAKSIAALTILAIIFAVIAFSMPAYAQQIKQPVPKTVKGYVFLSNGVTNAAAGTSVNISVINETCTDYANISYSNQTTTNDDLFPYPNYYLCTVNGVSGDNVTVLAWNNTYEYYGKNDTETLNGEGFTTVNVTMKILKTGDPDGDGLDNFTEDYTYRTDRTKSDTEDDGMPDNWEVDNELNPLIDDSALDPDGDGYTNLDEYLAGTDPQDSGSNPAPTPGPPVAVPEYNAIGLLALIGILTIALTFATPRRKK